MGAAEQRVRLWVRRVNNTKNFFFFFFDTLSSPSTIGSVHSVLERYFEWIVFVCCSCVVCRRRRCFNINKSFIIFKPKKNTHHSIRVFSSIVFIIRDILFFLFYFFSCIHIHTRVYVIRCVCVCIGFEPNKYFFFLLYGFKQKSFIPFSVQSTRGFVSLEKRAFFFLYKTFILILWRDSCVRGALRPRVFTGVTHIPELCVWVCAVVFFLLLLCVTERLYWCVPPELLVYVWSKICSVSFSCWSFSLENRCLYSVINSRENWERDWQWEKHNNKVHYILDRKNFSSSTSQERERENSKRKHKKKLSNTVERESVCDVWQFNKIEYSRSDIPHAVSAVYRT